MAANSDTVSQAWACILEYLNPVCTDDGETIPADFYSAVKIIQENQLSVFCKKFFIEAFQKRLRDEIVPEFWAFFKHCSLEDESTSIDAFTNGVSFLHSCVKSYTIPFQRLSYIGNCEVDKDGCKRDLLMLVHAVLFSQLPLHYEECIKCFYSRIFKVYHAKNQIDDDDHDEILSCSGCASQLDACRCEQFWNFFVNVNEQLLELNLLETLVGNIATNITHSLITEHVHKTCKGNFEESYLIILEEWLDTVVVNWLVNVYCPPAQQSTNKPHIQDFQPRLAYFLWQTYANIRMEELFNMIIEFPESQPAIEDLKECLDKTNLRPQLIQTLKSSFETRLLHPGVSTSDVLTAYISAIKALRVLDPTGVILQLVCEPLRKYLKTRDDTVRWIVFSLTDDSSNELADELIKGEPLLLDETQDCHEEMDDWQTWQPDPVDADQTKTSRSRKSSDIISTLVNIYGSKELFVREYRTLLADRILSQFHYDTQKEIRYMELLKLRFGESELHLPEVMLKDVVDSKRLNANIHSDEAKSGKDKYQEFPVNAMILSARFWPSFKDEKLELPKKVQDALDSYTKSFEALKGNRTLSWKSHLGLVNLHIEIKDKKISLNVSPIHATIIMHFEHKSKWTIDELSSVMKVPSSVLRRKMAFWQSQGLVKEEVADTYVLQEEHKSQIQQDAVMVIDDDDETESAMASSHDQREEELQVFWSYIVGMLTNLECLPLERIHSMLKMFVMQGPTGVDCSMEELKHFLERKVKEQKLLICGDQYRLPKATN